MQKERFGKFQELGRRITDLRRAEGLKQATLARMVGASHSSVVEWEYGRTFPSGRKLTALARALGVSVEDLTGPADPQSRIREQTEPYGDIPGARTVKPSDTHIAVLGTAQAGFTSPFRAVLVCPHCGQEIEIEGRRRE